MMTQSNNDHEALVAVRKANQLLAVCNLNWEQYLGVAKRMDVDEQETRDQPDPESENPDNYEKPTRMSRYDRTAEMLAQVRNHLERTGSPAIDFIASLERGLANFGSLTPGQMAALKKFHKNATRARAPF